MKLKLRRWIGVPILCSMLILPFWYGCSIISLPTYSESEYTQLIEISASTAHGSCSPAQTEHLADVSNHLYFYSTYQPHNELMAEGVAAMDKSIQNLNQRTHPGSVEPPISDTYCQLKLRVINSMATTLAQAAGGKSK
jgi:hypothetical protein